MSDDNRAAARRRSRASAVAGEHAIGDRLAPTTQQGLVFGAVAEAYDRGRPGYGDDAAAWLTSPEPVTVLELGAGTGKLTELLVALGHDVHATDPDEQMLAILRQRLPGVRTSVGGAEEIDAPDSCYDVVVAAQCFHWFDHDPALLEIVRVLKQEGTFAAVWNIRDERIPWVRKLGGIIGRQDSVESAEILRESGLFADVDERTFTQWQTVDRHSIKDLVLSRSNIALLEETARARCLDEVLALYDDYGRGMDGMQLPYRTECFRAKARRILTPAPSVTPPTEPTRPRVVPGEVDDAVVLIDFR